jgi:hypothetical protein
MMGIANPLEIRNTAANICLNSLSCENIFMNICRFALTVLIVCLLTTGQANAVQINLSGENVEQYIHILEIYVLPFLVVSTIVLLCGYIASRFYNRRLNKSVEDLVDEDQSPTLRDEGTAAFLRELSTTPPIKDPAPDREPRLRLRRRRSRKTDPTLDPAPRIAAAVPLKPDADPEEPKDVAQEPLLLRVLADTSAPEGSDNFEGPVEPEALEPKLENGKLEGDRMIKLPALQRGPGQAITPLSTLTADFAGLRTEPRETPNLDSVGDADAPVEVEPGDGPNMDQSDDEALEPLVLRVPADGSASDQSDDGDTGENEVFKPVADEKNEAGSGSDRTYDLPAMPEESKASMRPLTAESASPRAEPRETPNLDSVGDADAPVEVEPGDGPYLEMPPLDQKMGYDSVAGMEPPEASAISEEPAEFGNEPLVNPPPERPADLPLDIDLDTSAGDTEPYNSGSEQEQKAPALERTNWWADSGASSDQAEQSTSVVQPLKPVVEKPSREKRNAEKAATDIVRSLDRIASSLQQSMTVLSDHIRHRRGLLLEDVQRLRISGLSAGVDVVERLRALDQKSATDVHASYAAVDGLNRIVDRLEQMAADEALDEGWNDLIRTRLSETIYAVGQGKKTLLPLLPADPPATSDNRPEKRADDAGHAPHGGGVPFGTRQG